MRFFKKLKKGGGKGGLGMRYDKHERCGEGGDQQGKIGLGKNLFDVRYQTFHTHTHTHTSQANQRKNKNKKKKKLIRSCGNNVR